MSQENTTLGDMPGGLNPNLSGPGVAGTSSNQGSSSGSGGSSRGSRVDSK